MAVYGYARVSTTEQSLDGQLAALKAAGCERVWSEKESGAKAERKALAAVMKVIDHGDVLVVTRLDRLARSTRDLLNVLDTIAKAGAGFKSIAEPMIDTTSAHGRLVLGILAIIGEFERSLILARTSEGRKRAQVNGVRFGRPLKLSPYQRAEAIARREAGEPLTSIGRTFGVSHSTISRL